ncbi:kinase [Micromonospora haikouensis]|uniref:kinase n=1 Tax=Micromonospora haikouensis TaxID=686309 RepID=UPI0037B54ED5
MKGVILYGPPGVGKDTITGELERLDSRFSLYRRLKVGGGRTTGYRMTNEAEVDALRSAGEVIWENSRYDALYVIDRATLSSEMVAGIPVVHLGQPQAVKAVIEAISGSCWVVASLSCPRGVALERILARRTGDVDARMRAWDETEHLANADLEIDTHALLPNRAAELIVDYAKVMR